MQAKLDKGGKTEEKPKVKQPKHAEKKTKKSTPGSQELKPEDKDNKTNAAYSQRFEEKRRYSALASTFLLVY